MKIKKGFSIIEVVIAMGIFSTIIFSVIELLFVSGEAQTIGKNKIKAMALANEYFEEIKNIKRSGWNLIENGRFIITKNGLGNLSLTQTVGSEVIGIFQRFLQIDSVNRDQQGNIVTQGGTLDPSTKKITVTISWTGLHGSSLTQSIYLTRYLDNLAWKQGTTADFNAGEYYFTKLVSPVQQDGEIQLKGGCQSATPQALIYDDALRNGWIVNCSSITNWLERLICILLSWIFQNNATVNTNNSTPTYNSSPKSIKIVFNPPGSGTSYSWVRFSNYKSVCTIGFSNLHFYVYNPGSSQTDFYVTAIYQEWDKRHVVVPAGGWTEVSLDYKDLNDDYENTLQSLYFSRTMSSGQPAVTIYLDQMELTGGVGGYFTTGTFTSQTFDTTWSSAFNRISYNATIPANTSIGFQTAVSNNSSGPWIFYGPNGTGLSTDLYSVPEGNGIWLGGNTGRYIKFKAFLKSTNGVSTPILKDSTINYSP